MTLVPIDYCGCNAKLQEALLDELRILFPLPGLGHPDATPFFSNENYTASTDKVYLFTENVKLSVDAIVIHCLNDIDATLSEPIGVTAAFEFAPKTIESRGHLEICEHFFDACERHSVPVGKCHTTIGHDDAITISVFAQRPKLIPHRHAGDSGSIFITKPLGAFSLMRQMDFCWDEDSHAQFLSHVLARHDTPMLCCVDDLFVATDISGFGLTSSLDSIARHFNISCEINHNFIPYFVCDRGVILVSYSHVAPSDLLRAPEVAGPMLIFTKAGADSRVESAFRASGFRSVSKIGSYSSSEDSKNLKNLDPDGAMSLE